jgi:adenosylhomocysteine nucleosidase
VESPDLLVVAALGEELSTALELCADARRAGPGIRLWRGTCRAREVAFLRTGMGPERAAACLTSYLAQARPRRVLALGYGGALDPTLGIGTLVAVRRAVLLGRHRAAGVGLDRTPVDGTWELSGGDPTDARPAGVLSGTAVTSPWIIGAPVQKRLLHDRFDAAVIDMETAVLARAAAHAGVPLACIRSISDELEDAFLAPFTYDPAARAPARALRILRAGGWLGRYRDWRSRATRARASLREFARWYLLSGDPGAMG